jgi:hypothetical protein
MIYQGEQFCIIDITDMSWNEEKVDIKFPVECLNGASRAMAFSQDLEQFENRRG